jgi:hypothetical protein
MLDDHSVWWSTEAKERVMGDDDTRQLHPVQAEQAVPVEQTPAFRAGLEAGRQRGIEGPRTFGWAHAFMVVGVTFCLTLLAIVVLAVVFADRLPQ